MLSSEKDPINQKYYYDGTKMTLNFLDHFRLTQHFTCIQATNGITTTNRMSITHTLDLISLSKASMPMTRCSFATYGMSAIDVNRDRLVIMQNMAGGYCLTVYEIKADGQTKAVGLSTIFTLAHNDSDIETCNQAYAVVDKSSDPFYRSVVRAIIHCKFKNHSKIMLFRNLGSSSSSPKASLTLAKGVEAVRIEAIMYRGMFFMAYLTNKDQLYFMKQFVNIDDDSTIEDKMFISFPCKMNLN